MSVMLKHRDAPLPSLAADRPEVSPELEAVFARMVAKRPSDRYPTMAEVVRQLEQIRTRSLPAGPPQSSRSPAAAPASSDRTVALDSPTATTDQGTAAFELGPGAALEEPATEARPLAALTVVVAEPSRTQAGIIRNYLKQLGIETVHAAGSGREVIDTIRRVGAGVVISSLHLSDMTGVQLAAALRADPAGRSVGFVLATTGSGSELMAGFAKDARTVVMPKPFDLDRLTKAIASVTG
jgi:CheY-like chemotaxis protein